MRRLLHACGVLVIMGPLLTLAACGDVELPFPDVNLDQGQSQDNGAAEDPGRPPRDIDQPPSDTWKPPSDQQEPSDDGTDTKEDVPACVPECGDRECGLDPVCGRPCGDCDDGLDCTSGTCNLDGLCEQAVAEGHCLIAGECHAADAVSPDNACLRCAPDQVIDAWSVADDGAVCREAFCSELIWNGPVTCVSGECVGEASPQDCDDELECTEDSCDPVQKCTRILKDDYCLIGRTCLTPGQSNPADPCRVCTVGKEPFEWFKVCEEDSVTNLTWQEPAAELLAFTYADAINYCANLSIAGGGWRIPRIGELRSTVRGCAATESLGSCGVKGACLASSCQDSSCSGCAKDAGPADGCYSMFPKRTTTCWRFWSDTDVSDVKTNAWVVYFDTGQVSAVNKESSANIRCVK